VKACLALRGECHEKKPRILEFLAETLGKWLDSRKVRGWPMASCTRQVGNLSHDAAGWKTYPTFDFCCAAERAAVSRMAITASMQATIDNTRSAPGQPST
jgi:hypothetical protein